MKLEVLGIDKSFGTNAVLRGVDLTVSSGEVVALVGENGAGKSTLTRVIAGVYQADGGTLSIDGTPVTLHLFYAVKVLLYILGGWSIVLATRGIDGFTNVAQWWSEPIVFQKVVLYTLLFEVIGLGCYNREFARDVRDAAKLYGVEPLITDDYLEVEAAIAALQPELVLGTQMERHIAKRLRIPCAVISAPVHVQDFPARYSPQMGFEGANILFDTWVHPLVMGLEEHLLTMFRDDFEFSDASGASHLGHGHSTPLPQAGGGGWSAEAERELLKIPFFLRVNARRNTEKFAAEQGLASITLDTLYDAKAHYAR